MNNGRVSQIIDEHEVEAIRESFNVGDTECGGKNIRVKRWNFYGVTTVETQILEIL
jgi:hypothetical protein